MADQNIKKARVLQKSLPTINSETGTYQVRYRIVSEDKNKISEWSPVIEVSPGYTYAPGNIHILKNNPSITIVWDPVTIKIADTSISQETDYDVWIRFDRLDGGDWKYHQRVTGNTTSFLIPEDYTIDGVFQNHTPNKLTVEVFVKGTPISRASTNLLVYNPAPESV